MCSGYHVGRPLPFFPPVGGARGSTVLCVRPFPEICRKVIPGSPPFGAADWDREPARDFAPPPEAFPPRVGFLLQLGEPSFDRTVTTCQYQCVKCSRVEIFLPWGFLADLRRPTTSSIGVEVWRVGWFASLKRSKCGLGVPKELSIAASSAGASAGSSRISVSAG